MTDWAPKPARRYSWPPFEPGNAVAVRHGAESQRLVAARAEEIAPTLVEFNPVLADYPLDVELGSQLIARSRMIHGHIEKVAAEKGVGHVPSRLWESATATSRLEDQWLHDHGLTPLGRIRLTREMAEAGKSQHDLAQIWAEEGDDDG